MFTTIVVGTDGSDTAAAAVGTAVRLAETCGATLHLVSAYKDPAPTAALDPTAMVTSDPSLTKEASHDAATAVLTRAAQAAGDVAVETHAVCGPAADSILNVAAGVGADLVVVGSKGMTGARRVLGSVPNRVAHRATCHVLIAKTA